MKNVDHARGLVTKAEHDLKIARIGLEHADAPLDTICFHTLSSSHPLCGGCLTSKSATTQELKDFGLPYGIKIYRLEATGPR